MAQPFEISTIVEDTLHPGADLFSHIWMRCLQFLPALSLFNLLLRVNMNRDPGAEKSFLTALLSTIALAYTQCLELWEKEQLFSNVWVVSLQNSGHSQICKPDMCLNPWEKSEFNDSFNSYENFPDLLTHLMSYN